MENHLIPCKSDGLSAPAAAATAALKDSGKKKRGNRTAKLKQCKLDARRVQWLTKGKLTTPDEQNSTMDCGGIHPNNESPIGNTDNQLKEVFPQEEGGMRNNSPQQDRGETLPQVITISPRSRNTSNVQPESGKGGPGVGPRSCGDEKKGEGIMITPSHDFSLWSGSLTSLSDTSASRSSCSHSTSSFGESSSDEEDDNNSNGHSGGGVEDDWEAAADALHIKTSSQQEQEEEETSKRSEVVKSKMSVLPSGISGRVDLHNGGLMPEYKYRSMSSIGTRVRGGEAGRAWRPDDTLRPGTLPRLSKQHSFPVHLSAPMWGIGGGVQRKAAAIWSPSTKPPPPSSCPICTEELDHTDSSFVPCLCGFRLCLFCYHQICSNDGRCPGCRKRYNSDATAKLSRAASFRPVM